MIRKVIFTKSCYSWAGTLNHLWSLVSALPCSSERIGTRNTAVRWKETRQNPNWGLETVKKRRSSKWLWRLPKSGNDRKLFSRIQHSSCCRKEVQQTCHGKSDQPRMTTGACDSNGNFWSKIYDCTNITVKWHFNPREPCEVHSSHTSSLLVDLHKLKIIGFKVRKNTHIISSTFRS